jgi:hypothetical protein
VTKTAHTKFHYRNTVSLSTHGPLSWERDIIGFKQLISCLLCTDFKYKITSYTLLCNPLLKKNTASSTIPLNVT